MVADVVPKIQQLLSPRSIALVGATENSYWSRAIIQNLVSLGYAGRMHLIHPTKKEQFGHPCYPSLLDVPERIDHAFVMTGTRHAKQILEDCAAIGVPSATLLTAGFKEANEGGARLEHELVKFCEQNDITLLGPNCLGFVNALAPVPAHALLIEDAPLPGHVGVLLQSGAILLRVHQLARYRNIGLSYLISSGNEAMLDAADFVRFLVEDPDTRVIGALVEGIRRPVAFAEAAARAVELGKPLVVLKTGRSEAAARTAVAHTAALTGADAVVDAYLRQIGAIRVSGVEEMVETLGFLAAYGWPEGRRAGVVTPSGGVCGVFADLCQQTVVELPSFEPDTKQKLREILPEFGTPENPLDTTGVIVLDATLMSRTAEAVVADPNVDLLVVVQDVPRAPGPVPGRNDERIKLLVDTLARSPKYSCAMTTVAAELTPYGRELTKRFSIHLANGITLGIRALDNAIRYGESRRRLLGRSFPWWLPREMEAMTGGTRRSLNEAESKALLRSFGIPTTEDVVALSADEAVVAAERLGFPVVLKMLATDVPHKTDAGGVALDLTSAGEVRSAYDRIIDAVRRHQPEARIEGVLVSKQVRGAVEMIAGISVDPLYGPTVVVGLGGIFVETLGDVALRLPPIGPDEARAMLDDLHGRAILAGARGRPPADVDALIEVLTRLGELALACRGRLVVLDVNPLFVLPRGQGVKAADALAVVCD